MLAHVNDGLPHFRLEGLLKLFLEKFDPGNRVVKTHTKLREPQLPKQVLELIYATKTNYLLSVSA